MKRRSLKRRFCFRVFGENNRWQRKRSKVGQSERKKHNMLECCRAEAVLEQDSERVQICAVLLVLFAAGGSESTALQELKRVAECAAYFLRGHV